MDEKRDWNEKVNEITDDLERQANIEYAKAMAYHEGYVKACEDFGRQMRMLICSEVNE